MHTHFKLFASLFVHMGTFDNRKSTPSSWQWDWSSQTCAGAQSSINNLLGGLVDYLMIVCLKTDSDPLLRICGSFSVSPRCYSSLNIVQPAVTSLYLAKATFSQQKLNLYRYYITLSGAGQL